LPERGDGGVLVGAIHQRHLKSDERFRLGLAINGTPISNRGFAQSFG
jgi:hypothetical protein